VLQNLEPRDWYQDIKEMRSSVDFEKAVEDLVEKAKEPAFEVYAKNQIHEMLTTAVQERQFYRYAFRIETGNFKLSRELKKLGVDFRELEQVRKEHELVLSDRARQDLMSRGERSSMPVLSWKFEDQWKALNTGLDHYYDETKLFKAAQDLSAVLKGVQKNPDKDQVFKELYDRHPKAFDRLQELGQTHETLRAEVTRTLGTESKVDQIKDLYFLDAVKEMSSLSLTLSLRQGVLESLNCQDPQRLHQLEKDLHRFVGHLQEVNPQALKEFRKDEALKDRLNQICERGERQLEKEKAPDRSRSRL
jgi:hypothetical protein